jgi:hypothetical protein
VGAIVEACGLYLEARDPVRAAEAWSRLPRWAFSSDAGTSILSEIKPRYEASVNELIEDWRSAGGPSSVSDPRSLDRHKLISLLDKYEGLAELWWARSLGANDPGAGAARARAVELEPALADDSAARPAWDRIDELLVRKLKIELKAEKPQEPLALELILIGRIVTAVGVLVRSFVARLGGEMAEPLQLVPQAAHSGSFVFDVSAHGLPPYALEDLDQALRDMTPQVDARALCELLALLQQHRVRLAVFAARPGQQVSAPDQPGLVIDASRRKSLSPKADAAARERIDSRDVPQANSLDRVFLVAELTAKGEQVNSSTLSAIGFATNIVSASQNK